MAALVAISPTPAPRPPPRTLSRALCRPGAAPHVPTLLLIRGPVKWTTVLVEGGADRHHRKRQGMLWGVVVGASGGAASSTDDWATCRHCKQRFQLSGNSALACSFHPERGRGGGEAGKATGFCRVSEAPEHQLKKRGHMFFWDCCGAKEEDAPGCVKRRHQTYDEPEGFMYRS